MNGSSWFSPTCCASWANERTRYVYFPTESFVSLVTALDDGSRLEVGIVGDEGMLGASLMLGVETSPQHALVQGAGAALRMSASTFQRHYRQNAELRLRLNSYLHVLMRQLAQTAACTHYHVYSPALDSLPDGLVAEQQLHKPFMHANFLAALVRTLADASGPG